MSEQTETTTKKAKKSKAAAGPVPKTFERDLEVALTDAERLKRNEDLLEAMQARDDLKLQKSDATSLINAAIKTAEGNVKNLAIALRSGKEKRAVRCTERFLFETNTVEIIRTDTGAVIERRAMEIHERQTTLPGTEPKPGEPLTATVAEVQKAKRGSIKKSVLDKILESEDPEQCPKVLDGKPCTRPAGHRGAHGYRDAGPKA